MALIERYISRKILIMFLAGLLGVVGIVWTAQVIAKVNLVTDNGQSIGGFIYLSLFAIPSVVPEVAPFAFALAAAHCLNVLNQDSELVVINAAGASRMTVMRPLMVFGLGVAMLSFVISNFVEPYADLKGRQLLSEARSDLVSTVLQEGAFRKIDDNLFLQVAERLPNGALGGIFVSDSRQEESDLIYYAKQGQIVDRPEGDILILTNGEISRKDPDGNVSTIRFNTYAFDLSEFTAAAQALTLPPRSRSLGALFSANAANDPLYKVNPGLFLTEIHKRLTDWVYPILFGLFAFAVAGDARSHRGARINPIVTVIGLSLVMRWMSFILYNKSLKSEFYYPLLYILPLAALAITAYVIWSARVADPMGRIAEKAVMLWERFGQARVARIKAKWAQRVRREHTA